MKHIRSHPLPLNHRKAKVLTMVQCSLEVQQRPAQPSALSLNSSTIPPSHTLPLSYNGHPVVLHWCQEGSCLSAFACAVPTN